MAFRTLTNYLSRAPRDAAGLNRAAAVFVRTVIRATAAIIARIAGVRPRSLPSAAAWQPKRLLLISGGHIGDTLIAGGIIPVLRSAFPQCELGFAMGSWSHNAFKSNTELSFVHLIDHWRLNRSGANVLVKIAQHYRTARVALRQIRDLHYDVSLSLYPHHPDMLVFAWHAGIAHRVGFSRSLYASFATAHSNLPESLFLHQGARVAEILRPLGIGNEHLVKRKTSLPESKSAAEREVCDLLHVRTLQGTAYRIIHVGSGNAQKEMPPEFWRQLAMTLGQRGTLLFTGVGEREKRVIDEVINGLGNCINGCGRLSWDGFVVAIRYSIALYGVDTVAGHVAAAVGTKCILVYSGIESVARWRPESDSSIVFTNPVPCAPCFRPRGCSRMNCLSRVNAADLVRAEELLSAGGNSPVPW